MIEWAGTPGAIGMLDSDLMNGWARRHGCRRLVGIRFEAHDPLRGIADGEDLCADARKVARHADQLAAKRRYESRAAR